MKKCLSLFLIVIFVFSCFSVVSVSASEMKEIKNYWFTDDATITFTNGTDEVASYTWVNTFYDNLNCFTVETQLWYSAWYRQLDNIESKYCLPVEVSYVVNYLNLANPKAGTLSYTANSSMSTRTLYCYYGANGTVSTIYLYHKVNTEDIDNYNRNYSDISVTQVCYFE